MERRVIYLDDTISDNKIISREERLRISRKCLTVVVLEGEGTFGLDLDDNSDHKVEIGIGDARSQN